MTTFPQDLHDLWSAVGPLLTIRDEREYDLAVERLNQLVDEVGDDEHHPLYTLLDTLGTLVGAYEVRGRPMPSCGGVDILRFLMEEHGLGPSDLPELGAHSLVSEVLQGERELNARQIRALAERFHVAPAVFL